MHVKSARIGLREFCPDDLEAVLSYRSNPEAKQFDTFGVNSEAEVKAILSKAAIWASETPRTHYFGAVYDLATSQLVGEYALHLNLEVPAGEVGIMLHPAYWGSGLAQEVLTLLQKLAVSLELNSLTAQCHRDNIRSQKMLAKFGMTLECQTGESVAWSKHIEPDV